MLLNYNKIFYSKMEVLSLTTSETGPDRSSASDDEPLSLFDALEKRFNGEVAQTLLTRIALTGITRTLERYVVTNGLPVMFLINYQRLETWQQEAHRYLRAKNLIEMMVAFVDQPELDGQIVDNGLPVSDRPEGVLGDKETLIMLPPDDPLNQNWFLLILTAHLSILLCGKATDSSRGQDASREYETLISFEPPVINYSLDLMEQALKRYQPGKLASFQAQRDQLKPIPPDPHAVGLLTAQFVDQVHFYRQKGRQLDQEKAMRATIGRLLHDASQPVTLLVNLLDFARRHNQISPEEIEMLLGSANQLKQILDHLREVNRFRTSKVGGNEYLDTGKAFY